MNIKNIALSLTSALLLLAGCKNSGDDPLPPNPNPPAANQAPTANAGADQLVLTGATVSLSGSGSDPDGSIASLAWTQTSGIAVTLTGSNTGTPTFTAPGAAAILVFSLTATDNQGATSTDSVSVQVNALTAPVIVRQPTNMIAFENGIGLIFVVAQGENLNYEWHYDSGVLWTSGPEPYMVRGNNSGGLPDHGDCYYVIVSNAAGSVTSEPGCMTIIETDGISDPSIPADSAYAGLSYGNAIMEILRVAAGAKTGPVYPGRTGVPWALGPGDECHGATLDSVAITQPTNLPLGQHTITETWNGCGNGDPDEPTLQSGGIMISYDFPNEFGVGTYTMYLSGHGEYAEFSSPAVMNGIMTVTSERTTDATGVTHDDFAVKLEPHFGAAGFRLRNAPGFDVLEMHRTYNEAGHFMTDARIDWRIGLQTFDDNGFVGIIVKSGGTNDIALHYDPTDDDDDGVEPWSSDGWFNVYIEAVTETHYGARLAAAYGSGDWHFFVDDPPSDPDAP